MRIAFVGTGHVAWHLARACKAAGHELVAVVSRSEKAATIFAQDYPGIKPTTLQELQQVQSDVLILAVPDAAIQKVASELIVKAGTLVVHTSGSQPLTILSNIKGARTGVFYPVQTFTKYKPVDFTNLPILIEGSDPEAKDYLMQLGKTMSTNVQAQDSAARRQLHLAAVFACNFTNHLFGISQFILQNAGLPANLLQPLIQETITKASTHNPFTVQTGPASRNDMNVVQDHLAILQDYPDWQELYRKLTQSIQHEQKDRSGIKP